MATLTMELPPRKTQVSFNLCRWAQVLNDPALARIEGRIETDRHGHVIMSPPPSASHGGYQSMISHLLWSLMSQGVVFTECPISTADGVKAADVAWASHTTMKALGEKVCFPQAPDICVEVTSPSNSVAEFKEKMALYFDAGAREVWLCGQSGIITFYTSPDSRPTRQSKLCPRFPRQVRVA